MPERCDHLFGIYDLTGVASCDLAALRNHLSKGIDAPGGDRAQSALTLLGEVDHELRRRSRSVTAHAAVSGKRASAAPDDPVLRRFDDETAQMEAVLRTRHEQTLRAFDRMAHVDAAWRECGPARDAVLKRIGAEARAFRQSRAKQRGLPVTRTNTISATAIDSPPGPPGRAKARLGPAKDQPAVLPPLFDRRTAPAKAIYRQKLVDRATQTDDEEEEVESAIVRTTPKVQLVGVALVVEEDEDTSADSIDAAAQPMASEGGASEAHEQREAGEMKALEAGGVAGPVKEPDASEQTARIEEAGVTGSTEVAYGAERTGGPAT
jgi:hypothetical protein